MSSRNDIRNAAIIARVDHDRTALTNAMPKRRTVFRDTTKAGELVVNQSFLERERGIAIMASNAAIVFRGAKVNVIDMPGHADFGGEARRVSGNLPPAR